MSIVCPSCVHRVATICGVVRTARVVCGRDRRNSAFAPSTQNPSQVVRDVDFDSGPQYPNISALCLKSPCWHASVRVRTPDGIPSTRSYREAVSRTPVPSSGSSRNHPPPMSMTPDGIPSTRSYLEAVSRTPVPSTGSSRNHRAAILAHVNFQALRFGLLGSCVLHKRLCLVDGPLGSMLDT